MINQHDVSAVYRIQHREERAAYTLIPGSKHTNLFITIGLIDGRQCWCNPKLSLFHRMREIEEHDRIEAILGGMVNAMPNKRLQVTGFWSERSVHPGVHFSDIKMTDEYSIVVTHCHEDIYCGFRVDSRVAEELQKQHAPEYRQDLSKWNGFREAE